MPVENRTLDAGRRAARLSPNPRQLFRFRGVRPSWRTLPAVKISDSAQRCPTFRRPCREHRRSVATPP